MNTDTRNEITYDEEYGHVCTCTRATTYDSEGYPEQPSYDNTVHVVHTVEPTESGSYLYSCDRCGATAWSGC